MNTTAFTRSIARPDRLGVAVALSLAAAASAQAMQVTAEQRAACTPDAMRLCSSEIPDIARVTACMKANRAQLSARCQATFAAATGSEATPVASPLHQHIYASRLAANNHAGNRAGGHHHRYAVYAYRHHGHRAWGEAAEAMAIARQVMGGLAQACGSQAISPDICSMSGSLMGSMGGLSPY